jgi:hypothetical protein
MPKVEQPPLVWSEADDIVANVHGNPQDVLLDRGSIAQVLALLV